MKNFLPLNSILNKIAFCLLAVMIYGTIVNGATIIVRSDGSGSYTTITAAIAAASSGDILDIDGTFTGEGSNSNGIVISKNLTLAGHGVDVTFVQGDATEYNTGINRRVITISAGYTVKIQNMTIRHGYINTGTNYDGGGGIKNSGTLTLESCKVTKNGTYSSSYQFGGGLLNAGSGVLTVNNCTFSYNKTTATGGYGGAIAHGNYGTPGLLTIKNSTFAENISASRAGALLIMTLGSSPVNIITNNTFFHNQAGDIGGAIFSDRSNVIYTNNTIVGNINTTASGGGLYHYHYQIYMKNNILANNMQSTSTPNDFTWQAGTLTDNGYNLVEYSSAYTFSGTGDITGDQANLNIASSLADNSTLNGTQQLALSSGSVAIDAGNGTANSTVSIPCTDQRQYYTATTKDIGAYEYDGGSTPPYPINITTQPADATACNGAAASFTVATSNGTTFQWRKNGLNMAGKTAATLSFASTSATDAGTYDCVISDGCASATSNTVTLTASSATATITASGATTFCDGGSVTLLGPTINGYGVSLISNMQHVSIPINTPQTNITYELSFKTAVEGNLFVVYSADFGGDYDRVLRVDGQGDITNYVYNSGPTETISTSGTNYMDGQWHHVAVVIESGVGTRMYVDGALAASGVLDHSDFNWDNYITLGGWGFIGQIDNMRLWDVAKSAAAIQALSGTEVNTTPSGLLVNLKFNEGTGMTAVNSVNSQNCTLSSGSTWAANTLSGYNTYTWSNGTTTKNITVSASDDYSVEVSNTEGCTATSNDITVTVNPLPTATPSITAGGVTTFCFGGNVELTSSASNDNQWYKNGVAISGETNTTYSAIESGNYTVAEINSYGCSKVSTAEVVMVKATPAIPTINASGATAFCTGGSVELNSSSSGSVITSRYATGVVSFSTEYSSGGWGTIQLLGAPDVYPDYGDISSAWSPDDYGLGREYVELSYDDPAPVNFINIYETLSPGFIDTVYVMNPNTGLYEEVYSATAEAKGDSARKLHITFPLTTFNVSQIRVALTTADANDWVQIDAVEIGSDIVSMFSWSTGATTTAITVSAAGVYTATVTLDGCSTSDSMEVTVDSYPTATIAAQGATTFCAGNNVILAASSGPMRFASSVIDFSSESGTVAHSWSHFDILGSPDIYPSNYDSEHTWASATPDGQREYFVLGFDNPAPINQIDIYETYRAGAVDTVYIKNPNTGEFETVYTATAAAMGDESRQLHITFPLTSYNVSEIRIAINSPAVHDYNEIDAVSIGTSDYASVLWSTGATTESITVSNAGSYSVTLTSTAGCSSTSTATTTAINANPTATISAGSSTTFCAGGNVTLTANSSASEFAWSNGATTSSITISNNGNYTVTATASTGCSTTSSATTITVNTNPTATISAGGATTFCAGGNVTLSVDTAGISSFAWSTGASTSTITVSDLDSYTVTVTTTHGCSATSTPMDVIVNSNPAVTAGTTSSAICLTQSVTLNGGGAVTYAWTPGISDGQAFAPTVTETYTVTGTDANNCSATATTTVTVNNNPTATISAGSSTTFCAGGNVTLTANSSASEFTWSNGVTTSSITISNGGNYTVTATASTGCSTTSPATTITVNANPTATISAGGSTTFCEGGNVTLTANSSASEFAWSNGATTSSITITNSGNYTVTATASTGCSTTSSATTITVNTNPTATISAGGATTFCEGGNVMLTANSSATEVMWSNGAITSSITVNDGGNYTVTATSSAGCSTTSSATTITVNQLPSVSISSLGDVGICSSALTLNGGSPSGGIYSGIAVTAGSFNATSAGTGNHTIMYTYEDNNGCVASDSTIITVTGLPGLTSTTGGSRCDSGTVDLAAVASEGTLSWYADSLTTISLGTGVNFTTPPITSTTEYYVEAQHNNCPSPREIVRAVVNYPTSVSANVSLCAGQQMTVGTETFSTTGTHTAILRAANGCDSTVTIQMTVGSPITGSQTISLCDGENISVGSNTYSASGTYTDVVAATSGCDSTITTYLTVNDAIDVTTTVNFSTITANETSATYQWVDCNNNNAFINGEIGQSFTASANGDYAVIITKNNCSDMSSCTNITMTGINAVTNTTLAIHPNPNNGVFTVKATGDFTYTIFNELGQTISRGKFSSENSYTLDMQDLNNGIYYIIGYNDHSIIKQKIIVTK